MNQEIPSFIFKRIAAGEGPIQVWREQRAISVPRLAKAVGISPSALMELEIEGQSAAAELLARIAEVLRVPVEFLTIQQDRHIELPIAHEPAWES